MEYLLPRPRNDCVKQLQFINKKETFLIWVLEEAREIASKELNFQLKSNVFIGQCFSEMSF